MMWSWLRRAPKVALVLGIIVGSTVIFSIWWIRHLAQQKAVIQAPVVLADNSRKVAEIESSPEDILFVDNNLYDISTGEILFRDWIKDSEPRRLFWEAESKTILAQYEKGFIRYAPDGSEKGRLLMRYPFVVGNDYKWIAYSKNEDIWHADIDWKNLVLVNERQVTTVEQFQDATFAENVLFGTDKILIVRAGMRIVRVNMDTGEVHPTRLPVQDIYKRKSPDGQNLVGIENGKFYCYNIDSDLAHEVPVGRIPVIDYQWLGNDKCACLVNANTIVLYDRLTNSLKAIVTLPMLCSNIGGPSPGGRFVFCLGHGKGVLVDTEQRTATPVIGGSGLRWIDADTFAFSRNVPDSTLRGTWLQTVGEDERRISLEPYLVHDSGGEIMALSAAQTIVFATEHGLSTSNFAGTEATQTVSLARPPSLVLRFLTRSW